MWTSEVLDQIATLSAAWLEPHHSLASRPTEPVDARTSNSLPSRGRRFSARDAKKISRVLWRMPRSRRITVKPPLYEARIGTLSIVVEILGNRDVSMPPNPHRRAQ